MRKIKYLFLSLFMISSIIILTGCSIMDIFDKETTIKKQEITICYNVGDKKVYKTYDSYLDIVFESKSEEYSLSLATSFSIKLTKSFIVIFVFKFLLL